MKISKSLKKVIFAAILALIAVTFFLVAFQVGATEDPIRSDNLYVPIVENSHPTATYPVRVTATYPLRETPTYPTRP